MKKIVAIVGAICLASTLNQAQAYSKRDLADLKIYAAIGSLLRPAAKATKQLPGYDQLVIENSFKSYAAGFTTSQLKEIGTFSGTANKILSKAIEADLGIIAFVANCLEKIAKRKQGDITSWNTNEAKEVGIDIAREIVQKAMLVASGKVVGGFLSGNYYRWIRRAVRTMVHSFVIAGVELGYFTVCQKTSIQPATAHPGDLRQHFAETILFTSIGIGIFELLGEIVILGAESELVRSPDFYIDEILGESKGDQSDH